MLKIKQNIYLVIAIFISLAFFLSGYSHEIAMIFNFYVYGGLSYWFFLIWVSASPLMAYGALMQKPPEKRHAKEEAESAKAEGD